MPKFVDRIASTDGGYRTGDLSVYPTAVDDRIQLYVAANNAQTRTAQSISYNGSQVVVESTTGFPDQGIIRVGTEAVYYEQRTPNSFRQIKRGFAGSRQDTWPIGTQVSASVFAEIHNTVKDAIINVQKNLGTNENPTDQSLNGILKSLETRFLSPRPVFRAAPRFGPAPLTVKFGNFTSTDALRYFWDFGDGGTSTDPSPTHTYAADGKYTVRLNVITKLGSQGYATKTEYVSVGDVYKPALFYFTPSPATAGIPIQFVDQTDGDVTARYWQWGDGTSYAAISPDTHTASHTYAAGTYDPSLLIVFLDGTKRVVKSPNSLVVN